MADTWHTPDVSENTVLPLSAESELLARREAALRSVGYRVLSMMSEVHVRFEIEMGQCGVLLLCYTIHQSIHSDLAQLFTQRCQSGVIAFVMHPKTREPSPHAHVCFLDSDFPHKLHLIKGARTRQKSA